VQTIPTTKDAIMDWQRSYNALRNPGVDFFSEPLRVDGDWGARSRWAWDIDQQRDERKLIVKAALRLFKRGVVETSPNRGPIVDDIVRPSGLDVTKGYPWCICTVSFVMRDAQYEGDDDELERWWPKEYFASTLRLREEMARLGRNVLFEDILPGDVYTFMRSATEGHGGIVLARGYDQRGAVLLTFEGNAGNRARVGLREASDPTMRFHSALPIEWCPNIPGVLFDRLDGSATR
jgi:hypothetical protein